MILEVADVMFVRVVCVPIMNFCMCALKLIYPDTSTLYYSG